MNTTPTIEQVALAAANHVVSEGSMYSWYGHEDELAAQWLKNPEFVCGIEYATKRVVALIRHNTQMQGYAAQRGVGARGVAAVAGNVVGAWIIGGVTIDDELGSW